MQLMNNWLNKIEQKGVGTRLDPVSAEFTTKYMEEYFKSKGANSVNVETFAKEMLGADRDIPESLKGKFEGDKIKIISLEDFKTELDNLVPKKDVNKFTKTAVEMSKLQPQVNGLSILTEGQVRDILNGGHLNNPEFLQEFFKNRFGGKFMEQYKFVAQNDLDAHKKELLHYVNSIIEKARAGSGEVTEKFVRKASNTNLKMNALNWGAGFVTSALFLSTIIPKLQYMITKLRTGSDAFPGTKEFEQQESAKVA